MPLNSLSLFIDKILPYYQKKMKNLDKILQISTYKLICSMILSIIISPASSLSASESFLL